MTHSPQPKPPAMKPCHSCGAEYAGTHCPICKAENPTFTALKNISKQVAEDTDIAHVARHCGAL